MRSLKVVSRQMSVVRGEEFLTQIHTDYYDLRRFFFLELLLALILMESARAKIVRIHSLFSYLPLTAPGRT